MALPREIDPADLELLQRSNDDHTVFVEVVVDGAAYSCCGRGWQRRDGYEQTYHGWVDNLRMPGPQQEGTFMLYAAGLGTISYVVACRFYEVLDVRDLASIHPLA